MPASRENAHHFVADGDFFDGRYEGGGAQIADALVL
jgi:hypothetical protein